MIMGISNMVVVGMADMKTAKAPVVLTTLGLGSCVGIALFDLSTKVIGMAHCMLPDSTAITNNSNIAKFVDSAVVRLVNDMGRAGANKIKIQAKVAGGAQMFAFNSTSDSMRIGDRNFEATLKILRELNIPLVAKDCGSNYGRTIELYPDDGKLLIKTAGQGNKFI
jgi:chemotaxis protein CheD